MTDPRNADQRNVDQPTNDPPNIDPRRVLPSVEVLAAQVQRNLQPQQLAHEIVSDIARGAIDDARLYLERNIAVTRHDIVEVATKAAQQRLRQLLQPMINATGILLHTNLGRAQLGEATSKAMNDAAGATNLEFVIDSGRRGSRHDHAGHLLAQACGAEAGMVVNNNAAAVVLVLATLARGREVIVSRGELVEIGGGFRVPEILAETGARLIEVGTTNRTRLSDYQTVLRDETAMTLKVHASNY